jgi:hypothetical protein
MGVQEMAAKAKARRHVILPGRIPLPFNAAVLAGDTSPDISLWERFNSAYVKHFSRDLPVRAFIGSAPLLCNGRFEMMGITVRKF